MTAQLAIVLGLLAAAIVMFAINKPRMDAVALIMLVALPLCGVLTVPEALAGFSDANVVLIAALFVIGDGLVRTGVARGLGDWLTRTAGSSETRLVVLLMLAVAGLGAFMSSTAVTAIFIPVALRIARSTGASPGRLMMPLSAAALISGMLTLVATAPNLVVNSELMRNDFAGFSFFAFSPFGLPILAMGVVYMLFARRWLPGNKAQSAESKGPTMAEWIETYQLTEREHRVSVSPDSPWVGQMIETLRMRSTTGAKIIAIERGKNLLQPTAKTVLQAGDVLLVDAQISSEQAAGLCREFGLQSLPLSGAYFTDRLQEIGMAEVLLPANSSLIGKTLIETRFFDEYGVRVVGMRHGRSAVVRELESSELHLGDTLLVVGPWRAIQNLSAHRQELIVLNVPSEFEDVLPVSGKARLAVVCLAVVVGLMVTGLVPNVIAALLGCLMMGALGITDLSSAYRSIDWKTIVLIVGMLPFSIALQRTGGVELMADGLMSVVGGAEPRIILAAMFAITALLGMFISNTATAVLMAPVAITLAGDLGASPYPFAMIVALAASTAFMTPVSSPVNTLVVTPGNYSFGDFARVGIPFAIIVMLFCVMMVPWLLPL